MRYLALSRFSRTVRRDFRDLRHGSRRVFTFANVRENVLPLLRCLLCPSSKSPIDETVCSMSERRTGVECDLSHKTRARREVAGVLKVANSSTSRRLGVARNPETEGEKHAST